MHLPRAGQGVFMNTAATQSRARAPLGLRLPPSAIPAVSWLPWTVVPRAHGFHVSREAAAGGKVEFLRNEVRAVKVFRSEAAAVKACRQANFTANAERLNREPLLSGRAS
jgi:hypothetical protein